MRDLVKWCIKNRRVGCKPTRAKEFYLTRQTQYMLPHDKNIVNYIYLLLINKTYRNGK